MEGSPHLFDFEGEMAQYASLEEEIQELPELRQLGAILLSVGGWCKGSSTAHSIHTAIHAYLIHMYIHTYIRTYVVPGAKSYWTACVQRWRNDLVW